MLPENARGQLLFGYKKAREGLNENRLEDWTAFESVNASIGELPIIKKAHAPRVSTFGTDQ